MKLDVPDDYVPHLITALEHHYAYTRAVQREDTGYQQAADWLHRQRTPIGKKPVKRKGTCHGCAVLTQPPERLRFRPFKQRSIFECLIKSSISVNTQARD
jgi:hypothetical protein